MHVTIRARVLRILVLALAVLLALLGAAAAEQFSAYRNAAVTAVNARLSVTLQGFVHALQKERGLTTGYLGGVRQFRAGLPARRRATDTARARLEEALRGRDDAVAAAVRASLRRLDALGAIRRHADDGTGTVQEAFDGFTAAITVLDRLGLGLDDVHDGRLRAAYQALRILGSAKEFTAEEHAIVLGSVAAGRFRADDYIRFLQIRAGRLAALESFPRSATGAERRRLDAALGTPDARRSLAYESAAVRGGGRLGPRTVPPVSCRQSMTSTLDGLRAVQISLGRDIEDRAAGLQGAALRDLLLFVLFAVGTVAALGRLALDCVRSVSTPLDVLAEQAREVAGARLARTLDAVQHGTPGRTPPPAPLAVPVRAAPEVLQVAEAFDRVQRVAYELAVEQAVLRRGAAGSPGGIDPYEAGFGGVA
ncbi:nitrate- and nitrite sensing domain-containing protein [Streptomyces glomeratus]|uniref:Nitrate/nitrite sensing protein domain-containing protein n=1 Tax=Streptomyces glomeratus TaxID=284452 RepID=A0ABP6KVK1_9ACTN|nr:nitrate- and nitrite sensing domain-containing protein [Streptomyces glomeratus]MCF1510580.1 nitrate- and nitrite sensing domain-containing protein [Streptomyces glomeratus]